VIAGIAMPELVVLGIVEDVLETLSANPMAVQAILAERPAAEQDSILTALQHRPGRVRLAFSQETFEDWQLGASAPIVGA